MSFFAEWSTIRQITASLLVSLSMMVSGFIQSWTSAIIERLLSDNPPVRLTTPELSWVISLSNLGAILSPIPSSFLMDAIGRRNSLLVLYIIPIMGWVLVYLAQSFWPLAMARLLLGCWIGVAVTISPVYIGEIAEPKLRSMLSGFVLSMLFFGFFVGFSIGIFVAYETLTVLGILITITFCAALLLIPESPYFFLLKGKKVEALAALKWLRGDSDVYDEFNQVDKFVEAEMNNKARIIEIFTNPGYFRAIVTAVVVTILVRSSGRSLFMLLPIILPRKAFPYLSNDAAFIILQIVNVIFSFKLKWQTRFGIKKLIMVTGTVSGAMMVIVAIWELFKDRNNLESSGFYWIPFVCMFIFLISKNLGAAPASMSLKGEIFPTELKSTLSAITSISGSLVGFLVLKFYFPIKDNFGNQYNFVIGYLSCFALALFACFYLLETEGKSLEEIQHDLQINSKTKNKSNDGKIIYPD